MFSIRFKNEETHERLRRLAELTGQSMNDIVETAVEHELARQAAGLRVRLSRIVEKLGSWEQPSAMQRAERFAAAETSAAEPVIAEMYDDSDADPVLEPVWAEARGVLRHPAR